jgi:hypothetical protein
VFRVDCRQTFPYQIREELPVMSRCMYSAFSEAAPTRSLKSRRHLLFEDKFLVHFEHLFSPGSWRNAAQHFEAGFVERGTLHDWRRDAWPAGGVVLHALDGIVVTRSSRTRAHSVRVSDFRASCSSSLRCLDPRTASDARRTDDWLALRVGIFLR